jgi:hypothetical protein
MPMVTLSWNRMLSPPRILVGAISDRNRGTACMDGAEFTMKIVSVISIILDGVVPAFHTMHILICFPPVS